jgi:hypothetical protein
MIQEFLKTFRGYLRNHRFTMWSRQENQQTFAELGISIGEFKEILCKINLNDYHSGPYQDQQYSYLECWVFKKTIKGKVFYLRLQVDDEDKVAI